MTINITKKRSQHYDTKNYNTRCGAVMRSVIYAVCHLFCVPFIVCVIYADCHLRCVTFMLSVIYALCYLFLVSFMFCVIYAESHPC
jgi:hypothetical protein